MHDLFGDVERFVTTADLSPATKMKLQSIINNPTHKSQLIIELAITVDAVEPFVKATYFLEGDGPLVFDCYETVFGLTLFIITAYYPNTNAVISSLASENKEAQQRLSHYAVECVKPGYDYFESKFEEELKPAVMIFKAARYFDPHKVLQLKPTCCNIDSLRQFPCFADTSTIEGLKSELPQYMAKAADVNITVSKIDWWENHEKDLPNWSKACKVVLLFQHQQLLRGRFQSCRTRSKINKALH